ncbi:MAG: class II histone deacetylase [Hyphomicrobiaceae bacterium]
MAQQERLAIFWHDDVLLHDQGEGVFDAPPSPLIVEPSPHPEGPSRVRNMKRALEKGGHAGLFDWQAGRHVKDEEILTVHTAAHLADLKAAEAVGTRDYSRTTRFAPGSMPAIRAAAGTALEAVAAILAGRTKKAYALVRPPGHHAQTEMVDGYCFLNNAALAVEAARRAGMARVAVLDWDVHHGNGTQEIFYGRDDVLTISLHMHHGAWGPSHPQTGFPDEKGAGAGLGRNLNIDLPCGVGDEGYRLAIEEIAGPAIARFKPDLLVVANGQDAGQFDPNGRQLVSAPGFHRLALMARDIAADLCEGRLLAVQEGGYNPTHAALCALATAEGFIGQTMSTPDPISFMPEDVDRSTDAVRRLKRELLG